jgi:hypothetical protein
MQEARFAERALDHILRCLVHRLVTWCSVSAAGSLLLTALRTSRSARGLQLQRLLVVPAICSWSRPGRPRPRARRFSRQALAQGQARGAQPVARRLVGRLALPGHLSGPLQPACGTLGVTGLGGVQRQRPEAHRRADQVAAPAAAQGQRRVPPRLVTLAASQPAVDQPAVVQ